MGLFSASASILSPLGWICITCEDEQVTEVKFVEEEIRNGEAQAMLIRAMSQLQEFFSGERTTFDLVLNPAGTLFQKRVWQHLQEIPFGKTKSYMDLALQLGDKKAVRAVGLANGQNPIAIVIPCHRVIGADGSLTGYAGGLPKKSWLLNHEKGSFQTDIFQEQIEAGI